MYLSAMGLILYVQNLRTTDFTAISMYISVTGQKPDLQYRGCCHLEALAVVAYGMAAHGALRALIVRMCGASKRGDDCYSAAYHRISKLQLAVSINLFFGSGVHRHLCD